MGSNYINNTGDGNVFNQHFGDSYLPLTREDFANWFIDVDDRKKEYRAKRLGLAAKLSIVGLVFLCSIFLFLYLGNNAGAFSDVNAFSSFLRSGTPESIGTILSAVIAVLGLVFGLLGGTIACSPSDAEKRAAAEGRSIVMQAEDARLPRPELMALVKRMKRG